MYNILIVDDEPLIRRRLVNKFEWEAHGFAVCGEAANGMDAIEVLKHTKTDALLTDMKMPVMDGIGLLKYINDNRLDIKAIVISSYSAFQYTHAAIEYGALDYILKPLDMNELSDVIIKLKSCLDQNRSANLPSHPSPEDLNKEQFLKDFMFWSIKDHSSMVNSVVDIDMPLDYNKYAAAVFNIPRLSTLIENSFSSGNEDFLIHVSSVAAKISSEFGIHCTPYMNSSHKNCVFFIFGSNSTGNNLVRALNKNVEVLQNSLNTFITCGVGKTYDNFKLINNSFNEAIEALIYRKIIDDTQIIFYDYINHAKKPYIYYSSEQEKAFLTAVETCNIDEIQYNIDKLFFHIKSQHDVTFRQTYKLCSELLFLCERVLKKYEADFSCIFGSDITSLVYLSRNDSIEELKAWFSNAIKQIVNYIVNNKSNNLMKLMDEIKQYIDANYFEPISLTNIAEQFFINKCYLSTLFKKKTGRNFSDYLTDVRLGKASELLENTSYKILEIAHFVGYPDEKYFSKLFKKHYGIIPEQYRKIKA